DAVLVEPARRDAGQTKTVAEHYASTNPLLVELNKELAEHQKTALDLPLAMTLAIGPARQTHLLIRGDFQRPGVAVGPDVPAVLPPLPARRGGATPPLPTRLDLARWLFDPANPLT